MERKELPEIFENQLKLLAERSKGEKDNTVLCAITHAMAEIAPLIQSQSDDGLVSYPVQVNLSMQDLTDLYRGRHIGQLQKYSHTEI